MTSNFPPKSSASLLVAVVVVVALSRCSCASKVVLRDSGYEGVVVALEDDLPSSLCQDITLGLEVSGTRTWGSGSRVSLQLSARDRGRFSGERKAESKGLS